MNAATQRMFNASVLWLIVFDTLTLGFVTLGFEMVAGRVLTPLFGSGIYTWATIISFVVAGLMCGYFLGGFCADRFPSFWMAAALKASAGIYLLFLYVIAGEALEAALASIPDEITALFVASFVVCFPPMLILGMYSPLAVRLCLRDARTAGRVTGGLFALSSFGNIAGILLTTFFLVPNIGTRRIMLSFAVFVIASAVLSLIFQFGASRIVGTERA